MVMHDPVSRMPASAIRSLMAALIAAVVALATNRSSIAQSPSSTGAPLSVPAWRHAATVGVIEIHGEIDAITKTTLQRRLERALKDGCDAIVLELDTPGGEVGATLDICSIIKSEAPPNTVAWIRPKAYSAGTIIALSAREIVVAPAASFGDAAPITGLPGLGLIGLPATERAKIEAPIVGEVLDSARRRGYDERLVQAFVRIGSELWLVERDDGVRAVVDATEYERAVGAEPDRDTPISLPMASESTGAIPQALVRGLVGDKEVLQSPTRDAAATRDPIPASERGRWRPLGQLVASDALLVVRSDQARALGLAAGEVDGDDALAAWFGATRVMRYSESWSESLARTLTQWPIQLLLIAIVVIFGVIEFFTPGFGVAGGIATAALLVLVGAPLIAGLSQWWTLLAVGVGIAAVLAEVATLFSGGIVGLLGAAAILAGLLGLFVSDGLSTPEGQDQLARGFAVVLGGIMLGAFGAWLAANLLPRWGVARLSILEATIAGGARASSAPSSLPAAGSSGVATGTLRPSGRVTIDGEPFDAVSTQGFIEAGTAVRVIGHQGASVMVERST
jgi:membrane-bound serine protease (ClpP class)